MVNNAMSLVFVATVYAFTHCGGRRVTFTILPLEKFWRKEDASADKQPAGTTALEESQTAARAESSAGFVRNHRPSSRSPAGCSPDKRAAGPPALQLSARQKRADHSRAGEPSREAATAGRCGNMIVRGSTTGSS